MVLIINTEVLKRAYQAVGHVIHLITQKALIEPHLSAKFRTRLWTWVKDIMIFLPYSPLWDKSHMARGADSSEPVMVNSFILMNS